MSRGGKVRDETGKGILGMHMNMYMGTGFGAQTNDVDMDTDMAMGMSTALYTTLTGLIFSQFTKIQLVNLESRD